jgi:recombinational DNA repair protein RecT
MGIKTVIKQIAKILPRSTELDRVLDHEAELDRVERVAATAATHALAPRVEVEQPPAEDYDGCSDAPELVDGEVEG